eukprot:CAMPEP_0203771044 /NCGR_PEP_ID=MMETSP0099_2-20121227/3181_1 /ASSEMBLY_ACC=CAM_ASM_000209 /TAXON_ID=96639 /ORGANISM=" , Strain NY0313808BC1" /LENGTH=72 /DNA_ID=CAMNT_0050668315 /DNA_START=1312 /DNA_END=1530 /DNA_ORIENTATION=-
MDPQRARQWRLESYVEILQEKKEDGLLENYLQGLLYRFQTNDSDWTLVDEISDALERMGESLIIWERVNYNK